jgi:tRNA A-37 threonylcarbamoyl transferase component Bud32
MASNVEPPFPRLRLRTASPGLLGLPWELPLAEWSAGRADFRELPVGPSRHLVRFVHEDSQTYALKEEPVAIARREYETLRLLETLGLPAVTPIGLAEAPERGSAILVTEFLAHSLQYRRLLMRLPSGSVLFRDRLLDAMASLLVDLHHGGVYWGDCSLTNTLFRRDGDRIQAYLVDAETSEAHPTLSDGQRAYDLEVLVENVASGLTDLAALHGRPDDLEDAVAAAESVRARYRALWDELHAESELRPGDRFEIAARVRRLNDLGFDVDEIALEPGRSSGRLRLRVAVTNRRFHARELERRTGLVALEGQARLLMNDLREYGVWLAWFERRPVDRPTAAERWLHDVYRPTLLRLASAVGPARDLVQAYCDVLEHKWILSERAGRDIGFEAAIVSYLEIGAPAPEAAAEAPTFEPPEPVEVVGLDSA